MMKRYLWALLVPLLLNAAPDARKIFEESVRLFSLPNIGFLVEAEVEKPGGSQKRRFVVARHAGEAEKDLLIRFLAPSTLRCTTILTRERGNRVQTYVYFPSIGRVRIVPRSKENREAVGLGISYAELHAAGGRFLPVARTTFGKEPCYRIVKIGDDGEKRVYLIGTADRRLKKVEIYRGDRLVREVFIDKVGRVAGVTMVLAWHVIDRTKERTMRFRVDAATVTSDVPPSIFKTNRIKRCSSLPIARAGGEAAERSPAG
ncbi:outer membrane lipoprotein-sorting protein [Hydrogenimonas sp. SS33]|uniref:outer membrane lipoprotein-sorting protein n=1 Tax=Hydrogenimonas leucolamina TaxID=2954236 RepID=UPI00336BC4FD